jgi:hypothetical protein
LRFEVTHSPTIGELVKALAKAQLTFKPVLKQVDNAAFMRAGKASKYADLAEYIDATQESLAKNELVVMQWPDVSPDAKTMTIESLLCHGSGEWMRGRLTLPALGRDGFTAQSCGSSITYGRRYSYAAITGCASQDDDGNAASGRGSAEAAQDVAKEKISKLKAKASENEQESQQMDSRRIVWVKVLPNSDIAVNGFLADNLIAQFLTDIDAKRKPGKTGGFYYQFAPNYLAGFKELCEKQEVEIA